MNPSLPQRICFGLFEVDTRSRELRSQGSKISLQDQPFEVLLLLLAHAGEVVTREELSSKLWKEDTFVDFERGLNKAVNKLRAALRDRAEKPKYIETLPQRGYRFIARVKNAVDVRGSMHAIDSLAVLPLENLSGDPGQEFFSDGLTEELIRALSRIASLRVISRTSVMVYKGLRKSLPAIAKELGVDAVVEGSLSRSGQTVRVTVQLILASEDRHLWSERYDRALGDILQLQAEVVQSIADKISKVVRPDQGTPEHVRKVHPEAYEACLKGNFFRDKMTPPDLEKSIDFFTRAIELDPGYASAFGDRSRSYFYLGLFGIGPPEQLFPQAKADAAKALELDEGIASAHNAMAAVHIFYDWDWAAAEAESQRAVRLSPGESVTHAHLADYLSIRGRHIEAIEAFHRVLTLDPISRVYIGHFGLILYRARRYDESIEQCRKALEIDPGYANALWFLALSQEKKGALSDTVATLERAVSVSDGPHFRALLGRAYAMIGENGKASAILDDLVDISHKRYISPFDLAVVHVGLGNLDAAFEKFEEAYRQRVFRIIELTMPMFDGLRCDVRWQNLVERVGLPG